MVWGLFPAESLPGEQKYFIFSKGTYKVGRKGCDVIINTDKGVSRIHAELVVKSMTSAGPIQTRSADSPSSVLIRDCSKYGTFINKKLPSEAKVHEHPNKEIFLKDGDLLSFGTGNANYRFCFVPLIFFIYCSKLKRDHWVQEKISSIGACVTQSWSEECTHVLVDEAMPVDEDLIDAIVARKPVLLNEWMKLAADKSICTEIPSGTSYIPTLKLEGLPVKVVDANVREKCLAGYTFVLGSLHLYKFRDRLHPLLEVGGAKVLCVDEFCLNSQTSEDGGSNSVVLVISVGSANQFDHFQQLRSLARVDELKLISAVLCGHLDPAVVELPSILVSSSCSTDETIVADSDVEKDTVASDHAAATPQYEETIKHEDKEEVSGDVLNTLAENTQIPIIKAEESGTIQRIKKTELDASENECSDIIYSQDLIVRNTKRIAPVHSHALKNVVNFKCFKKREIQSGNSFKDLIQFSRHPYRESDNGSEEVAEGVKEEKKRKQMEAIADDLFNNEKAKRRGGGGSSIRELFTHAR